jgi:hypothetical protein
MHSVLPEDFSIEPLSRPLWQSLCDLTLSLAVVAAIVLATGFLAAA